MASTPVTFDPALRRRGDLGIRPGRLFIDGMWIETEESKPTIDPTTELPTVEIAMATDTNADNAVRAARRAFDEGPWPRMTGKERGRVLLRVADLMEEKADDLARREALDMGKPIAYARNVDVVISAEMFRFYAGLAAIDSGRSQTVAPPPMRTPLQVYTVREAVGVVVAITPFNFPLGLSCTKIAPALAVGNTMIHKPASATPLTALLMAEILQEAGVPEGVYNLITGPGGRIGDALVKHPMVDKIAFTGSTEVGKNIIRNAAETVKKVTMELGGKSANIVFADCDLDQAARNVFYGIYFNKGEICVAGSRLLVERSIQNELLSRLKSMAREIPKGDPLDPDVLFGPLADAGQLAKIEQYVGYSLEDGSEIAFGGARFTPEGLPENRGYFYLPTALTGVKPTDRVFQEEIFGPVLAVTAFDSEEEAVVLANATSYGLASGIQTRDVRRAHSVAARIRAGTCWINNYNLFDTAIPFGGYKQSGFGRELGLEALESYTQTKSIWIDLTEQN